VGRGPELDSVKAYLREALLGRPRLVLITGEAGIGKTRLLRELRPAIDERVMVLYGHCYEDVSIPYLPFVEIIRSCLEQRPQALEALAPAEAATIARLLGRASDAPTGDRPSEPAERDQMRLFLAASRLLIENARNAPLVLIVDDLQWADEPSAGLLTHLVFALAERAVHQALPFLVIATYRSVEADARVARAIERLKREEICETLELSGLDDVETSQLVSALGFPRPSHQLVTTMLHATGGNPLFVQEAMRHLARTGGIAERGGYLVAPALASHLKLPSHVTDAIALRVQALSDVQRRTLTLAAVLGERFDFSALLELGGLPEEELVDVLEACVEQRFLIGEGDGFRFAHPLVQRVLYGTTTLRRRQRLHYQIAEALERLYADSIGEHVAAIAHHLMNAGPLAQGEQIVEYAREAADRALEVYAWGEAARYYEAALLAARSSGRFSAHDLAELHYWAGFSYHRDHDVGPSNEHFERAIDGFRETGDQPGLVRALTEKLRINVNLGSTPIGTLVDVQPLEEAVALLRESHPAVQSHAIETLATAHFHARQSARAEELARNALQIAKGIHDDRLCARAVSTLSLAQMQMLQLEEALKSQGEAISFAKAAGEAERLCWPLVRRCSVLISLGRLDDAERAVEEARKVTHSLRDWAEYSLALSYTVSIAYHRGDFDELQRSAATGMAAARRSHYRWGTTILLPTLANARSLMGNVEEAEDTMKLIAEPGEVFDEPEPLIGIMATIYRSLIRARVGQKEAAGRLLDTLPPGVMQFARRDLQSLPSLCAMAEAAGLMGHHDVSSAFYEPIKLAHDRGALICPSWGFLIPRVLGLIASGNKWWDKAEAHYTEAIEFAARAGSRPELACSYLGCAEMLAARGRRGDRERAADLLTQATSTLQGLPADLLVRRAAQLAESLQARVVVKSPSRPSYPDNLSEREVEVLTLVARGQSNRQIADELVLSVKTVARHVSNIFNKIGVEKRAAAGSYAFERGLAGRAPPQPVVAPGQRDGEEIRLVQPSAAAASPAAGTAPRLMVILFTDMEGSTALTERLGDAGAQEVLRAHNARIRECLARRSGVEIKHTGDGVMAWFLSAAAAIECAADIQRAFAEHNERNPDAPIHVRVGLNAGEPVAEEGDLFGTSVQAAARIAGRAGAGQILVSDVVRQLAAGKGFNFADRGRVALKGFAERHRLYEVQWTDQKGEP
jgi:class 3 adenylate cyclase/DNA-binding CsgD family transcriptional regulator